MTRDFVFLRPLGLRLEKDKLSVIRMIKASLQNEAIKLGNNGLSEEEEVTILSRESKQRKSDRSHVVL